MEGGDHGQAGPYIAMLVAVVGVSFSSIFIRWSDSDPLVIAFYRMTFTSLILLPLAIRHPGLRAVDANQLRMTSLVGVILALHMASFITSVTLTSVANAIFLTNAHPLIVGVLGFMLYREGGRHTALGITLGFMGMAMIAIGGLGGGIEGDLLASLAGMMTAIYILLGRRIRMAIDVVPYVFLMYSSASICLLGMVLVSGAPLYPYPLEEVALFLALAVVSTIFGHTLFNWALRYVSASLVSVTWLGETVMGTLLAALLLSELPTLLSLVGGALIVIGIMVVARAERLSGGRRPGPSHRSPPPGTS